jgi:micrococcal nuclease
MTRRYGIVWGVALQLLLLVAVAHAETPRVLQAIVERVADGDTLIAVSENGTRLRLRLLGIDAPEIPHGARGGQPFGQESRQFLERLVAGRSIRIETFGPDVYRRLLAVVWIGDTNVNLELIREGLAEVYRGARCQAYCQEINQAEVKARRDRRGIWSLGQHESPAAFRKRLRATS